jgi:GNAT superfamily N-acetyltransferase
MKNIIPFKKDILFKTNLDEITSISLENTLSIKNDIMSGDFIISGEYKISEKSTTVEPFNFRIPFEIAIDENQRSKGYGTKVIKDVIDYAQKNDYKRVILDADFRNPKAKALYERLGFKVYNKKSFLKRGMYNMELKLYPEDK